MGEKLEVWIYEAVGFILITAMVTGAAVVFRPYEGSRQLAEVEEILDETLTEIGDLSARNSNVNRLGSGFANNVGRMSIGHGEVAEFELDEQSPPIQAKELQEISKRVVIKQF